MSKIVYSVPLNNPDRKDNETSIYRHPNFVNKDWSSLELKTIHDCYKHVLQYPNNRLLGHREVKNGSLSNHFTWFTTKEVFQRAEKLGSGLLKFVQPINEWKNMTLKFVGIYGPNTLNYFITDIGCTIYDLTLIPIYDTLGEEATEFAFEQTKMETCMISANHVSKILQNKATKGLCKYLKNLVVMDFEKLDKSLIEKYSDSVKIYSFEEVMEMGEKDLQPWSKVTPDSIYSFSYTSGTTGTPKGAMLSHKNIVSTVVASAYKITLGPDDVYLSYLPMAHVMERAFFITMLNFRCRIGIFNGDITKVTEDLKILKPTVFVSVPRLYNKMYDTIKKGISEKTGMVRKLIDNGIQTKLKNLHHDGSTHHWFYDMVVFKKMRAVLGGRVRIMAVGSAPISSEVLDFLKIAFCAPIVEGYGQTEAIAFEFATDKKDGISGHVGGPFPQNEFKLVDVPEMKYTNKDCDANGVYAPRGEIWVRGMNVIPGYYKLDSVNEETFTPDRWMQSGDVGMLLPNGALKIIDRKKNIFKLAQGEYIAPEKLESVYKAANPLFNDIFVYGDSLKSCLVAVLNIEKPNLIKLAQEIKFEGNAENLENNADFKKRIIAILDDAAKENKFNSLEKIKDIIIESRPWAELDLITNTFKKKRNELKDFYKADIDKLYQKLF